MGIVFRIEVLHFRLVALQIRALLTFAITFRGAYTCLVQVHPAKEEES